MNRERVLASLVQIDVVVHEAQRVVALDGAHAAGQVLTMADAIRREADSLGGEVFMETLAATMNWRQWGERSAGAGDGPALPAVQVAAPPKLAALEPGPAQQAPAASKPTAGGSFRTRKGDLEDLLPLRDFTEMREDGITYDAIARQLGVGKVIVTRYGRAVLPQALQDMKGRRRASGPDAEDPDEDEEDPE